MKKPLPSVGWREWVGLEDLGAFVKAKVDTGARTSSLHVTDLEPVERDGGLWVSCVVHPRQHKREPLFPASFPVLDRRSVRSSNGRPEIRYVVSARVRVLDTVSNIELTLTRRDQMGFPVP